MHQTARNDSPRLRFGPFEVDRIEGKLYKRGVPIRIENHPFQVLVALLERPDEIVTREELQERIWGDGTNVEFPGGLNTIVRKLRLALGDSADSPLFIETIPKKGYRLIAPLLINGNPPAPQEDSVPASPEEIHLVQETRQDLSQTPAVGSPKSPSPNKPRLVGAAAVVLISVVAIAALVSGRYGRAQRMAATFAPIQARKLEGTYSRQAVALSPDGRYVAYARWDGQMSSVRLRQVGIAGEVEVLPPSKSSYAGLTFSPSGNELYFVSENERSPIYRSLYRMPMLGGPTQKLIEDIDSPVSFSPDGRRFVFMRFHTATSILEVRTANADGSVEELLTQFPSFEWDCGVYAAWSRDGRTIAVPFHGKLTPDRSSLYAVDVATRRVAEVYSGSGCIGAPVWTPDDALIFPRGDDLWMVRSKDRIGGVRRLTGYGGHLGGQIDLSRDGKTAVAAGYESKFGLWAVPVAHVAPAQQLISGDASLAFVDELIDGRLLVTKDDQSIWTTKADGSDWQRVANVRGVAMGCGQFVVVRTDGNSLVRFNADGTDGRTLVRGPAKVWTCSLKGDALFYVASDRPQQVLRVPIEGGNPVAIANIQGSLLYSRLSISPDGNFLAYVFNDGVGPKTSFAVLRTSDGGLVKTIEGGNLGSWYLKWAPAGDALDYASAQDQLTDVWEQPLAGGGPRRLTHFESGYINDFHWSRDGKRLLVTWGPTSDDVVLLSGLQ